MIEEFTGEQIQLMEVVKNEWLDLLFKPSATPDHNKIKEPKVIIVDSPLGVQLTINMLARGQVWDQVREVGDQVGKVWDQVWGQVWNQGWSQVDQVKDQVRDQVGQV